MTVALTKDSIDLGIVTRDAGPMLAFYRDLLGFEDEGSMPVPGIGTMYRLLCGTSLVKIVEGEVKADAPPGGIAGATGYRYWTLTVSNLDEIVTACADAGRDVVIPPREIRPGIRIAMVCDPDGNWVEFLQAS
jgi:catechol 2,3-dioxygenase-like lactoylglutathione lyase family enzyme